MTATHLSHEERQKAVTLLRESRDALLAAVEPLTDAQWSYRQSTDRWTIGENVEHLGLVERSLFGQVRRALGKSANPEWEAATAGKETVLKEKLLDRSTGRDAPGPVVPSGEVDRAAALRVFRERRERSLRFATEAAEPLKAHTVDHRRPIYGTLNAYQWLLFIGYHTMRHVEQIADVKRAPDFPF